MRLHAVILVLSILLAAPSVPPASAQVTPPVQTPLPVPVGFAAGSGADYAAMRRAGATAVKLLADWSAIEPTRGTFTWTALDTAIRTATAAGLQVTLVLAFTPKWASLATGAELQNPAIWSRQPPKRVADWETFVGKAAARYRGRVREWQVWTALSLPIWRGTANEYFALVKAARARTRAADPANRVVLATPLGLDLISIRRALRTIPEAFDAIALNPRGVEPDGLLLPLATLRERLLGTTPKRLTIEWDPRASGDHADAVAEIVKVAAIVAALKVDRLDLAIDPAIASTALRVLATQLGRRPYAGFLEQPKAIALVFGDEVSGVAVAWSAAPETAFSLDGEGITALNAAGDALRVTAEGGRSSVVLERTPLLLLGLAGPALAAAGEALRTKGFPELRSGPDFSRAAEVVAKLRRVNEEDGLYNMRFRTRRNGAVEAVEVEGSEAVRTSVSRDVVFVYFDVDDSFLYYVDGRHDVEVRVEVRGAGGPQQLGFNLLYDSMTGYRFTPWQWVEAKDGWVTLTFRLTDAAFANTLGWDFAINAGGNRSEDLTIRTVTVRKTPR